MPQTLLLSTTDRNFQANLAQISATGGGEQYTIHSTHI